MVQKYGKGQPSRVSELPMPQPGENEVLVRILAAGVNPLDGKLKDGEFKIPLPYKTPFVLGNDLAGVIEQVGSSVRRFEIGQEVFARPDKDRIGTFAEYLAVNENPLAVWGSGVRVPSAPPGKCRSAYVPFDRALAMALA